MSTITQLSHRVFGRWRAILLLVGLCLYACAHTPDPRPGLLVWGHEVRAFLPCGTEQALWFKGDREVLDPLVARYQELTDIPYDVIYVELIGAEGPKSTDGFAADYDGVSTIQQVSVVRAATVRDCRYPQGLDR